MSLIEEADLRIKSQVRGTSGPDVLTGNAGNDVIFGDRGNDFIDGSSGDDCLRGGKDNDTLSGGSQNDLLYGDREIDSLSGGLGNDTLYGGKDNDTLNGDGGNDFLSGDKGSDLVTGGVGSDTFFFLVDQDGSFGTDTITDFNSAEGDIIGLQGSGGGGFNLPVGSLAADEFRVIDNFLPNQSNGFLQAIIYDSVNGLIYFNESAGTGDEIPIARVSSGTQLDAGDFQIF
jgi:Ca2+-binding RTX toxin-like protein